MFAQIELDNQVLFLSPQEYLAINRMNVVFNYKYCLSNI